MLNKYTYSQHNCSNTYYCSSKLRGCRASVKLEKSGQVEKVRGRQYEWIPTPRGRYLLMLNQFTYSQDHSTLTYYCSSKLKGCKASVKLDKDGNIEKLRDVHLHEPPKYLRTNTGNYVKL
ncbi:hypothetical protein PYW08_016040 [Mythimna loreyi]|uniref:Uncharacterized protein n=1 Tax=Mythimna loreyi TaxID=667449 RepID=A0ACC2QSQ3_9NEOP|nr:hypothetical protein PYW08_016040 [Mythimna loreyi]